MKGKLRDFLPLAGGEWLVSFVTRNHPGELFDRLKGKDVDVEIKKFSPGRSLTQNAFLWALCSDIGKAFTPPQSKEDIYRHAIKAVGVYTQVTLLSWDVKTVLTRWGERGTGWFAEVVDDAKLIGHKTVNLYYGTSTYTVDEMRKLLDWLIDEAQQLQIPLPLGRERNDLYREWGLC
jgi:hypothetical protein